MRTLLVGIIVGIAGCTQILGDFTLAAEQPLEVEGGAGDGGENVGAAPHEAGQMGDEVSEPVEAAMEAQARVVDAAAPVEPCDNCGPGGSSVSEECNPSNCAGCCKSNSTGSECFLGVLGPSGAITAQSNTACGLGGRVCQNCPGQDCVSGACANPVCTTAGNCGG